MTSNYSNCTLGVQTCGPTLCSLQVTVAGPFRSSLPIRHHSEHVCGLNSSKLSSNLPRAANRLCSWAISTWCKLRLPTGSIVLPDCAMRTAKAEQDAASPIQCDGRVSGCGPCCEST